MVVINNKMKCFYCSQKIEYFGTVQPRTVIHGDHIVFIESLKAVGTLMTKEGKMTEFKFLVTCPKCNTKNEMTANVLSHKQ